jgi:hypothetical protein
MQVPLEQEERQLEVACRMAQTLGDWTGLPWRQVVPFERNLSSGRTLDLCDGRESTGGGVTGSGPIGACLI